MAEVEDQGFVFIANEILEKCKISGKVESISQCSDSFFIAVYEGILGEPLKGIVVDAVTREDKIHNCDVIIDALSCDVLNVDLSHITGEDIVDGHVTEIQNLLEIFKELLDFILDIDDDPDDKDEQNDSNAISNHEVISDVLNQELGSSYESLTSHGKLLTTRNLRAPLSSNSSTTDMEISMIPKWSKSVGSSQSSRCNSSSTGEIIRQSELLECQLAREYPSLHKFREQKEQRNNVVLHVPQESARETELRTKKTSEVIGEPEYKVRSVDVGDSKVVNKGKISKRSVSKHKVIVDQNKLGVEAEIRFKDHKKGTDIGLKGKIVSASSKLEEVNRLSSSRLLNHSLVEGASDVQQSKNGGEVKVQSMVHGRANDRKLNNDILDRKKLKVSEGTVKSKLHSKGLGTSGIEEGRKGSRSGNRDAEERRIKGMYHEGANVDGSDISEVSWEHQISPLDASEELHRRGTGLALDQVGTSLKRIDREEKEMNNGVGESQDNYCHESPLVCHFHNHFHHPHDRRSIRGRSSGEHEEKIEDEKKRCVKFKDDVDTVLITNRLERLKNEMEKDERELGDRQRLIKLSYGLHLDGLNTEYKKMEKKVKQISKTVTKPSAQKPKRGGASRVLRSTTAVYSKPIKRRKARFPSGKARKRSFSVSPKDHQKKKTAKQIEKGDILLPTMLDEFPFLHLSPHSMQTMRKKQTQQLLTFSKTGAERRQTKTQKAIGDAEQRQQTLLKILRKDLIHNQIMREQKERNEQERAIKSKLRDRRQATARARRYYEDYQLRMRARLLKRRTREEQVFKNLFQDGLEIQKERVRELRTYAKEQRETRAIKQQNELESLENYYRDQYSMLASAISEEKEVLKVREKAQEKVIHQMQRNLRQKLQKEVAEIQETLVRDEDDAYFRRLDAERLRRQMQMTAFQNFS